jgi:hypothetical protein
MVADRNADGTFKKGVYKGGPGRRRVADEERYLSVLRRTLTVDDWAAIVQKAIDQAKRGDSTARAFLANYAIGRPTEYINVDATSNGNTLTGLLADVRGALQTEDDGDDADLATA